MSGVAFEVRDIGFDETLSKIDGIDRLDETELLQGIGRLLQESTRNRIEITKTSPDGAGWKANNAGTSTLFQSGNLSASIDYTVGGSSVFVGSALIYARIHQEGGEIRPKKADRLVFMIGNQLVFAMKVTIPPRPYLGLSAEDKTDIIDAVEDQLRRTFH